MTQSIEPVSDETIDYPTLRAANEARQMAHYDEAASLITKQADRIAALEAALIPFAEAADSTDANDDYSSASIWEHPSALDITIGHLRAARRAARNALVTP